MDTNEELLTSQQAADFLHTKHQWIRSRCADKSIPAFKLGGAWRIKRSELLKWVDEQ